MPQPQLEIEKYRTLFGTLSNWRNKNTDRNGYKGILPFVSGLRFSVQLLYIIKKVLEHSNIDAAWGHIIDKNGQDATIFSNECDIIIYKKIPGINPLTWNGPTQTEYKAMDFKFIRAEAVVGVISCKGGQMLVSKVDEKYPNQLNKFTKNVWLFAEYCSFNSYNKIKAGVKQLGYKDFWCFYEWNEKKEPKANMKSWKEFDKKLLALAKKYSVN